MAGCCNARGCDRAFTRRFARRTAKQYRKRGLDRTARAMVSRLGSVEGVSVLEVGGGVGAIQVELLRRGAARTTNLELSPAYEQEAAELLAEAGLSGRADRRILDLATAPDEAEPADVVVLHRVVCCYPDYARLLGAAAGHARRQIAFSHPPRNRVSRAIIGAENAWYRLRRSEFRVFTHPPGAMRAVLAEHGFANAVTRGSGAWQYTTATR